MGRGGNELLDQVLLRTDGVVPTEDQRSSESAVTDPRLRETEERISSLENEITAAAEGFAGEYAAIFDALDSDPRCGDEEEELLFDVLRERVTETERKLWAEQQRKASLLHPVSRKEKSQAKTYRTQGLLIAEALKRAKIMKAFAENLSHIRSRGREESKDIESAFLAALPPFLMVKTPGGKTRKAHIHTAQVSFNGQERESTPGVEMDDRFWADILVEIDDVIYPFEFKAVADNSDYSNLMGDEGMMYMMGVPLDETGKRVGTFNQETRNKIAAQALALGFNPESEREMFLFVVHKDELRGDGPCTGARAASATSAYAFSEVGLEAIRNNSSNGLQIKAARIDRLEDPRTRWEQQFLFAEWLLAKHEASRIQANAQDQAIDAVRTAKGPLVQPLLSGREAAASEIRKKPRGRSAHSGKKQPPSARSRQA